jgi:hypothetical protein
MFFTNPKVDILQIGLIIWSLWNGEFPFVRDEHRWWRSVAYEQGLWPPRDNELMGLVYICTSDLHDDRPTAKALLETIRNVRATLQSNGKLPFIPLNSFSKEADGSDNDRTSDSDVDLLGQQLTDQLKIMQ